MLLQPESVDKKTQETGALIRKISISYGQRPESFRARRLMNELGHKVSFIFDEAEQTSGDDTLSTPKRVPFASGRFP